MGVYLRLGLGGILICICALGAFLLWPSEPGAVIEKQPAVAAVPAVAFITEEAPQQPQGVKYDGSAVWSNKTLPSDDGRTTQQALVVQISVPHRQLNMVLTFRRNNDAKLPASHTILVEARPPSALAKGGIAKMPGVLAKPSEAGRAIALSGATTQVTQGVFLIGLSAIVSDVEKNMALLKGRYALVIPVVYGDGTRALITVEKGVTGEQAVDEAFRLKAL